MRQTDLSEVLFTVLSLIEYLIPIMTQNVNYILIGIKLVIAVKAEYLLLEGILGSLSLEL